MSKYRGVECDVHGSSGERYRHLRTVAATLLSLLVLLSSAGVVHAQSTFIAGNIYAGASQGRQPVYAPNVLTPPVSDATVMVQNQHSGGAHIAYATVYGNLWAAEVPCPGDYVVMISALGYDSTSREFTLAQSDCGAFNFQDAYLPPLPLPSANLLVFAFYDNMVNGEPDLPDDEPLDGVTFTVSDPSGNVLATGVTGTQSTIVTPSGLVIYDTRGLYYFTDLPPGEVIVTSDPSRVHEAPNPRHNWNASTEFYLTYSEEGGRAWEVNLYPGDDGTEAGGFMIWHGYVEKLGQISAGNLSERFPAGTDLAAAGSIRGFLLDADGNDPAEPMPPELASVGVSANDRVPDGLVILFTDDETVPVHPVATTEADPVTGEYAFTNLPPGRYKMMAYDTPIDYVWVQRQIVIGPNEHIVGSGDPTQLNPADMFIPRFYARCQGYVYDAATGLPMANQEVRIRYKSGSVQQVATTDANGWYNFDDLPEIEVLGHVDVKLPPGYRGARRDQDFSYAVGACSSSGEYCRDNAQCPSGETCNPSVTTVTHNAMNRYLQWYTANYRADLYLEPISAGEGDIRGFVWNDELATGTWVTDGVYDEGEERTIHGVTVELWDRTGTTLLATTTTGKIDKAALKRQGWTPPYTFPIDEWGGVFDGPLIGFYEFRGLTPGDYTVKVILPPGFSASPTGSDDTTVTVTSGEANDHNVGIATLAPLAGEIEGGVFDDLNIDGNPLSLLYQEKAGISNVPVGVYDHLGYSLGVGYMGNPLCYEGSSVCPAGAEPLQKPEIERRFAPGVHIYYGNDPAFEGHNPNYESLVLAYSFGQGKYKLEADWSLPPRAFLGLGMPLVGNAPILAANLPVITNVAPVGSYRISGHGFGADRGYSTVTLSGRELFVTSWSDNEIHVDDLPGDVSGPLIVTTPAGPSNAMYVDAGYIPPQAVFVDVNSAGNADGSVASPWPSIGDAVRNLPTTMAGTPRYVFVAPGTYREHVQITESDVYIIGSGPLETIVEGTTEHTRISQGYGNGGGPVFFIGAGGETGGVDNVMISGLTITGGSVEAEIGGGIFGDYGNRDIDINNCVIVRNGGYYGGGIWLHHSNHNVRIWSNTIAENGNYGGYGGGISINDEPEYGPEHGEPEHVWDDHNPGLPPGTYKIFNNHILHNFSPDYGGGVSLYEVKDRLELFGNLCEENKADDHGGCMFFEDTGPIEVYGNEIIGNYCRDDGGALSFEDVGDDGARVRIYNNLIAENIADDCGENHARGGGIAFDDTLYVEVYNNTIVNNIVAGSYSPAGGGIDSERFGHEYNGGAVAIGGRDIAPGFSDPKIYNNVLWGNMRLSYEQPLGTEEEDNCYNYGINYVWTPDDIHVDDPAVNTNWETQNNSESLSFVVYNDISDGSYADRTGNLTIDPGFESAETGDWRLSSGSPLLNRAPVVASALARDIGRRFRDISDGLIDVGAYEFGGTSGDCCRVSPACGNGVVDLGEACDDGNTSDNDACLNDCTLASCGDGILCSDVSCTSGPGGTVEQCDDANGSDADSCLSSCTLAACGDGILCSDASCTSGPGGSVEQCDDANGSDADSCLSSCTLAACGDGILCSDASCTSGPGGSVEQCDDANGSDADSCLSSCTLASCGDGVLCSDASCTSGPGGSVEQCDDANGSDADSCLSSCTLAACGDGILCSDASCTSGPGGSVEQCDDANGSNADSCLSSCTLAACGDGVLCSDASCTSGPGGSAEQCDDANSSDNDACLSSCTLAACGDGVLCSDASCTSGPGGSAEQCDDANSSDNDACLSSCTLAACGDGVLCSDASCTSGPGGSAEQCDDANSSDNDACLSSCTLAACGDGILCSDASCTSGPGGSVEQCDDANASDNDACLNDCTEASCGDGILCTDASCTSGPGGNAEQCDDANASDNDACLNDCTEASCGDGILCTDASCTSGPGGSAEQCDDANSSDADSCLNSCTLASCGDGVLCTDASCTSGPGGSTEQCDDANASDADSCLSSCTLASCGDGVLCTDASCTSGPGGSAEQCDDANSSDADSCLSSCTLASCGDGVLCTDASCTSGPGGSTEQCDDANASDADSCLNSCTLASCGDGVLCSDASCTSGPGGSTEQCDDANASDADSCLNSCTLASCGDGILCTDASCTSGPGGSAEQCDDANGSDADSCLSSCTLASCGDGILCTDASCTSGPGGGTEHCDDANDSDNDACLNDCSAASCGDGILCSDVSCTSGPGGVAEHCDDANASDNDTCLNDCTVASCGDGILCTDASCTSGPGGSTEQCDDANASDADSCLSSCTLASCGDGVLCSDASCTSGPDGSAEQCDDGLANSGTNPDACRPDCAAPTCGDGVVDSFEQCEPEAVLGEVCNNLIDDDGDGAIDCADDDCPAFCEHDPTIPCQSHAECARLVNDPSKTSCQALPVCNGQCQPVVACNGMGKSWLPASRGQGPAAIRFDSSGKRLDVLKIRTTFALQSPIDPAAEGFSLLVTNAAGVVYQGRLGVNDLVAKQHRSFAFRDPDAKSGAGRRDGLSRVVIHRRNIGGRTVCSIKVGAWADLSAATQGLMRVQVTIGNDGATLEAPWKPTRTGWKLSPAELFLD